MISLAITDNISNPASDYIGIGIYPNTFYNPACQDSTLSNCRGCILFYGDNIAGLFSSALEGDSVTSLNITSCSGSPPQISGTFVGELTELSGTGRYKQLTNGKLNQVLYSRR